MKKTLFLLLSALLLVNGLEAQNNNSQKPEPVAKGKTVKASTSLKNDFKNMDSLSYSLGVLLAQNIKNFGFEHLDANDIAKGINDVLANRPTGVSVEQANTIVSNEIALINEKKSGPMIEEGKKFLAENAKKPGIKTTASGLQYEVISSGTGATPKLTDQVTTHYRGTLINGKQFDSSYDRGEPATFPVNGVIKGWTEALQLMKEGDKWRLYIPYNLAYGERGAGQDIPPYSALIFDIELLKVN